MGLVLAIIIEQVAFNKLTLILKIQIQNTQTLQLFTNIIKTEIIYKSYENANQKGSRFVPTMAKHFYNAITNNAPS